MVGVRAAPRVAPLARWADLGDASSGSGDEQEPRLQALSAAADDSYREAPAAALEDSRASLIQRLVTATGLEEPSDKGPQDFGFLMSRGGKASSSCSPETNTPPKGVSCDAEAAAPSSSSPAWQPNVHAPEFIPTLTMMCPVVCVLREAATPAKARSSSPPASDTKHRREPARKRRPSVLEVPVEKRTKSEERDAAEPADPAQPALPRALGSGGCPCPAEASALPEASEEDWLRRAQLRQKAVDLIKSFAEYRWYADSKARGAAGRRPDNEPATPDPRDRTISKRRWKYLTSQWRSALHQRHMEECHGSVVSTEEWQSSMTTLSTEDTEGATAVDPDDASSVYLPT